MADVYPVFGRRRRRRLFFSCIHSPPQKQTSETFLVIGPWERAIVLNSYVGFRLLHLYKKKLCTSLEERKSGEHPYRHLHPPVLRGSNTTHFFDVVKELMTLFTNRTSVVFGWNRYRWMKTYRFKLNDAIKMSSGNSYHELVE